MTKGGSVWYTVSKLRKGDLAMQKKELNKRFLEKKQIETTRLILRRICRTDAEDMFAYASLPCVTRYLTWQEHPDILHTKRYLAYPPEEAPDALSL